MIESVNGMNQLKIIYEDDDIILCHKPSGVATQTKRLGQQDMESLLKNYRAKRDEPPYIGIVHRLDQPVEGIMVFAKNQKAAADLSKQVQQHGIGKHYYAISQTAPKAKQGVLEDYLLTDKKNNYTQVAKSDNKNAKKAKLEYCVVKTEMGKTLFDIQLHTGRQHQIRVQMAHMGCPLVGDNKYGIVKPDKICAEENLCEVQDRKISKAKSQNLLALCSYRLVFQHPVTGRTMDFSIVPQGRVFQDIGFWM